MVADLLALQVQLGVLQLGRQPLALLLELLQSPLALVTVGLQVPELGRRRGAGSQPGKGPEAWVEKGRRRGGERGRDPRVTDGVGEPNTLEQQFALGHPQPPRG